MQRYRIEDSELLTLGLAICFFVSEMVLLTVFLALGIALFAAVAGDAAGGSASMFSAREALRCLGASVIFVCLSGYFVSVALALLVAFFRTRLLSLTHLAWATVLFVFHAAFFLLYLRGPAVLSTSLMLIAIGAVSVVAAATTEYVLWRKWLLPRGQI